MIKRKVAIILFYDDKGDILLQNRRTYSKHGEEYGFFGGKIEENENAEQALKREMKEELGLEIKDYKLFKNYHQKIPEINREVDRWVFLAPMPNLKKLKVEEGEPALMKFTDSFKLKMIPGDVELLKEIYKNLKDKFI